MPGLAATTLHPAGMSGGQTWLAHPLEGAGEGCQERCLDRDRAGQGRRGICLQGLQKFLHSCGRKWGESSFDSHSAGAQNQDPSTGTPSQPCCHQAMCPCPLLSLAPSSPRSWRDAGAPWRAQQAGVHQRWDARSNSVQGQAPEPVGKRSRGGGWHAPAGSSARSVVSPGQGQEEARLRHCRLPCQTSAPEEALSAANASQQPPQSLRAWQDALRLHLLQMDCIRGRTKHWRVFKEKLQSQPAREAAGPLWRHLTGDSAGSGLGTKTHRAAGCCPLALPSWPQLYCPMVEAGQEPFNGCWPEDSSSIFTKKCPAAKSGLTPAANEKLRLGLWFFPAPKFLGKLVRARIWSKC